MSVHDRLAVALRASAESDREWFRMAADMDEPDFDGWAEDVLDRFILGDGAHALLDRLAEGYRPVDR